MQIIIDIPEKTYQRIQALDSNNYFEHDICGFSMRRTAKGIPLPKGHGRLIDADALCDYFWDNRSKLYTHKDLQIVIDDAPIIIEADKSESEEQNI